MVTVKCQFNKYVFKCAQKRVHKSISQSNGRGLFHAEKGRCISLTPSTACVHRVFQQ